uniref:Uncharacterized protein n=1 Tax=Heterorhabditis bacteriophora TaxID=37862 RepID=A0A1I7W962_HETBA
MSKSKKYLYIQLIIIYCKYFFITQLCHLLGILKFKLIIKYTYQFMVDVAAKMKQPPFNCSDCTEIDPVHIYLISTLIIFLRYLKLSVFYRLSHMQENLQMLCISTHYFALKSYKILQFLNCLILIRFFKHLENKDWNNLYKGKYLYCEKQREIVNKEIQLIEGKALKNLNCFMYGIIYSNSSYSYIRYPIFIGLFCLFYRSRRQEEERLNRLWQIPFNTLIKPTQKVRNEFSIVLFMLFIVTWFKSTVTSSRSLQSTITTSTKNNY